MLRILLIALLAYLALGFVRRIIAPGRNRGRPVAAGAPTGEMVSCSRCGTFVIGSEALRKGDKNYCSEGCRDKP